MDFFDKFGSGWTKAWPYDVRALGGVMMGTIEDLGVIGVYHSNPEAVPELKWKAEKAKKRVAGLAAAMAIPGGAPIVGMYTKMRSKAEQEERQRQKSRPKTRPKSTRAGSRPKRRPQ
jgi:hypothetical protein